MYTIEYAYELADQYVAKTNGYITISIHRWNHNSDVTKPYIDYGMFAQALDKHEHFNSIDALVERLKELLA